MDVKDYCKGTELELTAWKAKLYDMSRRLDAMPSASKEKVIGTVEDLHMIVAELEDRIAQLKHECPAEWSPVKAHIDEAHVDMRAKYDETMKILGKHAPVSIPG